MTKRKAKNIPKPKASSEKLRFSFEYYDTGGKYCLSAWDKKFVLGALKGLKEVSAKNHAEVSQANPFRLHEVDWNETVEKKGFPTIKMNTLPSFQFALPGVNNQQARVFGGYSKNIFFIVWFDLNHAVWPVGKKNT